MDKESAQVVPFEILLCKLLVTLHVEFSPLQDIGTQETLLSISLMLKTEGRSFGVKNLSI
jgi:hypothetical protein